MQPSRDFKGFKAGKNGSVQVPNPFFSELLPLIDDLAELKLTIYCFWALQQREGKYRYVRLRDLVDDQIFMARLDSDAVAAGAALHRAVHSRIPRGTLLHRMISRPHNEDHLYFMHTEKGRAAVETLPLGHWQT